MTMPVSDPQIHFWCPDELAEGVSEWDPDREPRAFASSVGHGLFEPFVRLRRAGLNVALGALPAERPAFLVTSAPLLWRDKDVADEFLRTVRSAADRYVLIRGDVPLWWHLPLRPVAEVMPNRTAARARHQTWLPPLPQRGLRARNGNGVERIARLALKANPENVPPEVQSTAFREALRNMAVELWLDVPRVTNGSDQSWHDFTDVDVSLCVRRGTARTELRKPATKLINSWAAGCIPLAMREPGYVEIAREGRDVWFLDSVKDIPSTVRHLNDNPQLLQELVEGVRERQREFEPGAVIDVWADFFGALASSSPPVPGSRFVRSRRSRATIALWRLRSFHHGARIRNRVRAIRDLAIVTLAQRGGRC